MKFINYNKKKRGEKVLIEIEIKKIWEKKIMEEKIEKKKRGKLNIGREMYERNIGRNWIGVVVCV